ncbi:MAG: glycine cleavage system protein GcvH [Peptococcaceae bacterium]|nr:glycine cleavage system protein GcvH [Peptococcaceae bacterium]
MKVDKDIKYSKTHEWVKFLDDTTALIGLTDYAQEQLGDLVFINMPAEGDEVSCDTPFGDIESVKAVSDINSPVDGIVAEVNEEIAENPENINSDPYGSWIIKVSNITEICDLMDADSYERFCQEEA